MKTQLFQLFAIIFLFALSNVVKAQSTHTIDFEPSGEGANWNWVVAENADNPPLEFIANPVSGGINTSATVAKFTARQTGNPWALFFTDDDGQFTFDATNTTVKIMVYKTVISPVHLKLEGPGYAIELTNANTVINQWEELSFDFSSEIGKVYYRLVILPDLLARSQDNIIYIDNIQVPDGVVITVPEPTVAAPAPTEPANNVISVFSDVYDDIPGTNLNPGWGQSTAVTILTIQGDTTMKYGNLNYQGIELGSSQNLTAAGMQYLHLDFWNANSTELNVFLISPGPNQQSVALVPPGTAEQWISVDIPLTQFLPSVDLTNAFQMMFTGNGTVYLDNIYFYEGSTALEPTVAAPTPPVRNESDVTSLFSDAYPNVPVDTWRTDWSAATLTDLTIEGNPTKKYTQLDFVGIETVSNQLNVSDMTHFHIDVWSPNFTFFGIKLVDFGADGAYGGGDDVEHQINFTSPTQGEWVSLDIPLSDFTGLTTKNNLAQYILVGQPTGSTTVYVDNVYFYKLVSDVKEIGGSIPTDFALEQNYPNPFNPTTNISFSLPEAGNVSLKIYNALGQEVTTLVNQFMNAGRSEIAFDAANLPTGIYLYSLTAGNFNSVKKMILIK